MPHFQYVALNEQGRELQGSLEAADARTAAASLRGRTLFVMQLTERNGAAPSVGTAATKLLDAPVSLKQLADHLQPIKARDRVFFFQQMALMLRTGLTLLQALDVCRQQTSDVRFAATISRMSTAIQSGKSFSQALALEQRHFPVIVIHLIESAEASGELDTILDQVALYLERKAQLRMTLLTSITYPCIVLLVSIGVATFLVVKVIPKFAAFFTRRQAALPWSTQMLLNVSGFVQHYGLFLAVLLGAIAFGLAAAYTTDRGRRTVDHAALRVPVVGNLLRAGAMAQFGSTLSMLLRSGVTLLESLRLTSGVVGNRAIAECVDRAASRVLEGRDLATSLKQPFIPVLVSQVAAVGERTGALDRVLGELGQFYDRELQSRIARMAALFEPVMILIIGGMVGFVYFAFFQAVFQVALAGR